MVTHTRQRESLPGRRFEQALAGLFVGLLGLYAVGRLVETFLPVIHTAGVVAVHLAVVVGFAFPAAVVGRAVYGRIRRGDATHGGVTVLTAGGAIASLVVALLRANASYSAVLVGIAAGGSLLLAGRVLAPVLE